MHKFSPVGVRPLKHPPFPYIATATVYSWTRPRTRGLESRSSTTKAELTDSPHFWLPRLGCLPTPRAGQERPRPRVKCACWCACVSICLEFAAHEDAAFHFGGCGPVPHKRAPDSTLVPQESLDYGPGHLATIRLASYTAHRALELRAASSSCIHASRILLPRGTLPWPCLRASRT